MKAAIIKAQDVPHNIRQAEELKLTTIEAIAFDIAYMDGKNTDRWKVHGRREEIETALRQIGMLNSETKSIITNFIDSCRESL